MNKDMLAFLKGMLTVAVLLLLSTPLILMNVFEGDLSGPWIGFWGSFAGGILGTAGVIYVAQLQNKEQQKSIFRVEKYNRERLSIQTKLEMVNEFKKNLLMYKKEIDEYKQSFSTLIEEANNYSMGMSLGYSTEKSELVFSQVKTKFISLGPNYFSDSFSTLETNSVLLSQFKDIELEAFTIKDRKSFEHLDKVVFFIKIDSIDTISNKSNVFNMDISTLEYLSPFALSSVSLDNMNKKISTAQSKLIKQIDDIFIN